MSTGPPDDQQVAPRTGGQNSPAAAPVVFPWNALDEFVEQWAARDVKLAEIEAESTRVQMESQERFLNAEGARRLSQAKFYSIVGLIAFVTALVLIGVFVTSGSPELAADLLKVLIGAGAGAVGGFGLGYHRGRKSRPDDE